MQRAFSSASRASVLSSGASTRASLARTHPGLSAGLGLQQQRFAHKVCYYSDLFYSERMDGKYLSEDGFAS